MLYVVCAYLLDLALGSIRFLKVPVRLLEWFVSLLERLSVRLFPGERTQKLMGAGIVAFCVLVPFVLTLWGLLAVKDHPVWFAVLNVYLLFLAINAHPQAVGAKEVYSALREGNLPHARRVLSKITGKDTSFYSRDTVLRVCVEDTARCIVEDVTAPMFYGFIGGAPVAFLYRAANLLGKRMDFGEEGFRHVRHMGMVVDDALGYLPTRVTALVMYVSCRILGLPCKRFFKGLLKDLKKRVNLNDVYPQSIVARRLGILLGNGVDGVWIGEFTRPMDEEDILMTVAILRVTSLLFAALFALLFAWKLFSWWV